MKARAIRVECIIIDHEGTSDKDITIMLENMKYIHPRVLSIEAKEIPKWEDNNPLNLPGWEDAARRMFNLQQPTE